MESLLRRIVQGTKGLAMANDSRSFSSTDLMIDDGDPLSWEIVDPSDDDEGDLCSYDSDGGFGSLSADHSADHALSKHVFDLHGDLVLDEHVRVLDAVVKYEPNDEGCGEDSFDYDDDGDDDGYGEDDDLDDELVPKCVSDRFWRQRMRKLGKRAYPKMNKSKRLPYYYNRPGCVHGKHGLGLKHSVI